MRYSLPAFEFAAFRVHAMALAIPVLALAACDGGKEEEKSGASSTVTEGKPKESPPAVAVVERPEIPPLSDHALGRVAEQCVLIRVDGHPDRTGILIRGNNSGSGRYGYQIICDPPTAPDSILCATMSRGGNVVVARATKMSSLPGGLHVYGFSSAQSLPGYASRSSRAKGPVYACQLEATGSPADEERDSITEKLRSAKERLDELREARRGPPQMRSRERRPRSREDFENMRRERQDTMREQMELAREIAELQPRLSMAVGGIATTEVAAAATEEEFQEDASALASTVLVSRDSGVRAIRYDDQWVSIDELLENAAGEPSEVALNLYGSRNDVRLSCSVDWALAFGKTECSIVAATTYELESMDGGSLEERLAKVKPEPMTTNRSKSTANKTLRWNGEPTSVWIKVFQDDQPEKPIIDEVIEIDHADRFQAKWGRSPSPLIAIPQPEPDTPPDLAGEAKALDAGGTVLDLVAAGDGSVLMVQTDKPPFWQALDLRTGRFIETPWKAGPDTLLAAQAGKIHLIDRKTKIVETWDIDGKSRIGLQILQLDGEIVAAAAPLSAPGSPLLITTTTEGAFVDPVDFEVLANGFDMSPCFSREEGYHGSIPKLVPESIRLRASHDGALFSVSGTDASGRGQDSRYFRIVVDPTSAVRVESTQGNHLPARGRLMTDHFPDHGGKGIQLRTTAGSNSFPGPAGTIVFAAAGNRQTVGELRGSPVVPPDLRNAKGPLARDRGLYFDSTAGMLVVPEDGTLHLIPVNLPEQPVAVPQFNFAGETVSIPLPKGSGHKLFPSIGGDTTIGETEILWSIPANARRGHANLKLEWNGELGSAMDSSLNFSIIAQASGPSVESSDGKTSLPLRRTGIISDAGSITGFAGSGNVMLTTSGGERHAWSLTDCRKLFTSDERPQVFLGDADQLYTLGNEGRLKAYDILTGEVVKEVVVGKGNDGRKGLSGITTGISSRFPLLAVERDGHNPYLQFIDRSTLEPMILDLPRELQRMFFIPQFETNPSGNTTWSRNVAVFLKADRTSTVTSFPNNSLGGSPDESGRYVVSRDGILDIRSEPPVMTRFEDMPGGDRFSYLNFDASGRYVLLLRKEPDSKGAAVSVRDVRSPAAELFKIRFPSNSEAHSSRLISGAGKLICQVESSHSRLGVFEMDAAAILRELAESSQNR